MEASGYTCCYQAFLWYAWIDIATLAIIFKQIIIKLNVVTKAKLWALQSCLYWKMRHRVVIGDKNVPFNIAASSYLAAKIISDMMDGWTPSGPFRH